jgi:prepilin-type N-terminal cleavage/methylation domain-containing protein
MDFFLQRRARRTGEQGFTLWELMIVLAILAILAALLLGPLQYVLHKGKLTRTIADINTIGSTWCGVVGGTYANCGPGVPRPMDVPIGDFPQLLDAVQRLELESLLGIVIPQYDPWGEEFEYRVDIWPGASRLMIRSQNDNKVWDDTPPYQYQTPFPMSDRVTDIVFVNCHWVQYGN